MKNKFFVLLIFVSGAAVAFLGVYTYELFFSFKKSIGELKNDYRGIENNYNYLRKKYKESRDKISLMEAKSKKLKEDKDELNKNSLILKAENKKIKYRLLEANKVIKELKEDNKKLTTNVSGKIENILKQRGSLSEEIDNLKSQISDYKKKIEIQDNLPDDVLDLKNKFIALQSKEKRIQDKYIECSAKIAVLTEKANRLMVESSTYKDTLSRSNDLVDTLRKERDELKDKYNKAAANMDVARRTIIELSSQNKSLSSENNSLKKRIARIPQSMAELAQLKKQLKKEKTLFHYNLGVFYTRQGDYKKAVESFNKVIAVNPQDADVHYNLGVLYSEYLNDNKKAIEHFKDYLNLAPNDPDSDKARKYLLLQESIEGHK